MKLQVKKIKGNKNKKPSNSFIVIEYRNNIAVKKGDNIYPIHPAMLLIADRSKVYASHKNDKWDLYYELERPIKPITSETSAILYWYPYKPGQRVKGEIINGRYYDNKRDKKLQEFSDLFRTLKDT